MSELKQTTFSGYVKNNVIVLDDRVELPDGIRVIVTVSKPEIKSSSGLCGIWQDDRPVEEIVQDVVGSRSASRNVPTL